MELSDDDAMGGYGHEDELDRQREQARRRGEPVEDESEGDEEDDRLAIIEPVVRSLVAALGGWEVSQSLIYLP